MRCFIAVDLPEKIKEKLRNVKFDERVVKIILPSDYHITLKFLGDVTESKLERVKKELARIRLKPFKLKIGKIGFVPNSRFARVIWIGIMPKRKIIKLKEDIDNALVFLFEREKKFEPHITLGRIKSVRNKDRFMEMASLEIEGEFKADSFKLIKSELTKEGSRYDVIEEYS